jgi:long-subunit fatty acid transport protein
LRRVALASLAFFSLALAGRAPLYAADKPFAVRALTAMGYDNNALLNSERHGDAFGQEALSLAWKLRPSRRLRARFDYDVFNVNYFEVTDQNVLWQSLNPGLDYLLDPRTALQFDYRFDYLYFPRNEIASYRANSVRVGVLRKLNDRLRLKAGVGAGERQYVDNLIRNGSGAQVPADDRSDDRWSADAELQFNAWRDGLLRAGFEYTRSDSDDFFNDFYDYDSYAFKISLTAKITPKAYCYLKTGYENLVYDSRPTVEDPARTENSDVYTAAASLYYALRKDVSLGFSYTYRQKISNEPSQSYSGSISTLGLYYTF